MRRAYQHAFDSSTIACNRGNVIRVSGHQQASGRLEASERRHLAGLCRRGTINSGGGKQRGGHVLMLFLVFSKRYLQVKLHCLHSILIYITLILQTLIQRYEIEDLGL